MLIKRCTHDQIITLSVKVMLDVYPCLAVDVCLLLQEELHHLDVSIVTGHMKGGVAHLEQRIRSEGSLDLTQTDRHQKG